MTFVRIIGITVATSVIVFLGLTFLLPRHHEDKAQTAGLSPDQVFNANATPPAPGETPAAAAAPATDTNPAAPAASTAPTETAAAAPSAAAPDTGATPAPAGQAGLSDEEARKIAEDVGRKVATRVVEEKASTPGASTPAPAAPAAASEPAAPSTPSAPEPAATAASPASGDGTMLTESDVRRIAAEEARRVYAERGTGSPKKSPRGAPAKTAPAHKAAAESEPAAPVAAAPTSEPAPAPAAVTPAAKPAKVGKTKHPKAKDMPGDKAAVDAISSWWPATDKQVSGRLNLIYAGEAAFEKAVVLLFDYPMDASAAASHLELYDANGKVPAGSWSSGGNPNMLLFKGVTPGRYTVVVKPDLADTSGKLVIAAGLHGPVYVH